MKHIILILLLLVLANSYGQTDDDIKRIGLLFNYDLSLNFADIDEFFPPNTYT